MDEISMFAGTRPAPPADAEQRRLAVRHRLDLAMARTAAARAPGTRDWRGTRRPVRLGRRPLLLAGAATALAAGAAIAVPTLLPGRPLIQPAWAVQRTSGGTITVTIRHALTNQAALQAKLRAEGVPAYVRSMTGCGTWQPPGGLSQVSFDQNALLFPAPGNQDTDFRVIVIHPAAIPAGNAVFIGGGTAGRGLRLQIFLMPYGQPPVCAPAPATHSTRHVGFRQIRGGVVISQSAK